MAPKLGHGIKSNTAYQRGEKSPFNERGATGLRYYGGRVAEEWHPNLRGRRAAKVYREMRENCAVIGSVFFAAEEFITNNGFEIHPHKDGTPQAHEQAEHARQCFDDMEHTASSFISEAFSTSWHGFGLHQKVFKVRKGDHELKMLSSKHNDGRVGIRKLPIRSQDTIEEWQFTEHGDITGCIQQAPPANKQERLLSEELLHFRTTSAKNNPEGRSWLRNAYRSWWFLKRIQEYESIGVSKDMAGVPLARGPREIFDAKAGTDDALTKSYAENILARMQRGEQEYVFWPAAQDNLGMTGWDIGLMQSGGRRPMDVDGIIRRYESRILVSMLAEAVLLGQQGNVGSWSLASTQSHMFAVALGGLQRKIAEVINRDLLPELARLNGWAPQWAPTLEFADLESEDMIAKVGAIVQAAQAGLIVPDEDLEAHLRKKLGLPPKGKISQGQLADAVGLFNERADAMDLAA